MSRDFWYKFGFFSAMALRLMMVLLALYGIVTEIWNRQIPYLPLTFLFVFLIWTKTLGIFEGVAYLINTQKAPVTNNNYNFDSKDLEGAVNAIFYKNMYGGGPN